MAAGPPAFSPGYLLVKAAPACGGRPRRLSSPRILERWPRGRRRRFAKPLYGPKAVSRVRIPPSPQLFRRRRTLDARSVPRHTRSALSRAAVAHLDRAPAYEGGGSKFESCQPREIDRFSPPRLRSG